MLMLLLICSHICFCAANEDGHLRGSFVGRSEDSQDSVSLTTSSNAQVKSLALTSSNGQVKFFAAL